MKQAESCIPTVCFDGNLIYPFNFRKLFRRVLY